MRTLSPLFVCCALIGCSSTSTTATRPAAPQVSPAVRAAVEAPDRSDKDRALDAQRHPAEVLTFVGIAPGQRVAELGVGGGWTTELLARTVGPTGTVYGMNPPAWREYTEESWGGRLKTPVMARVVRVDRDFDDPLPPEATNLDAVIISFVYHDTTYMGVDRARMNSAIFAALKPGGVYAVLDSSARDGTGVQDAKTLHRIDEQTVRSEVEAAGFRLAGTSDVLRNPADPRDWNSSPSDAGARRGTQDRFVDKFVKP
jgi:predicted methyltransferase